MAPHALAIGFRRLFTTTTRFLCSAAHPALSQLSANRNEQSAFLARNIKARGKSCNLKNEGLA